MLEFNFIEDLPIGNLIVMPGVPTLTVFVCESTLRVPGEETSEVVGRFLHRRIPQFSSLGVVPEDLVGVVRIGDWLCRS